MNAPFTPPPSLTGAGAETLLSDLAAGLRAGDVIPFLGSGIAAPTQGAPPMTAEALAAYFAAKVALPKRARGNCWASAQHIESTRHRSTVTALMREAFASPVAPGPLHLYLASLPIPLIVESWYDAPMRTALGGRTDWGEAQGITRAGIGEDKWYRFYDAAGAETTAEAAPAWTTLLYKPHGGITPAGNFLISDADYVEVLTEIDIQTPLPDEVKNRRQGRRFLFIFCRFHDQLLRNYARQIIKRSAGGHVALIDPERTTPNEWKFFAAEGITPLALTLADTLRVLTANP